MLPSVRLAEAADHEEAVEMVKQGTYTVLLTASHLRDRSGIKLLDQVKDISPDTTVLLFGANGGVEYEHAAIRKGAAKVLSRTTTSGEELVGIIKKILNAG